MKLSKSQWLELNPHIEESDLHLAGYKLVPCQCGLFSCDGWTVEKNGAKYILYSDDKQIYKGSSLTLAYRIMKAFEAHGQSVKLLIN